ncbi:MAG: hypothetical protein LBR42_03195 [Candidatus Methanoplasma sp.]|jgi:hypothetical protein|nr:hypothetical protein [Candidatus Methanoplasma sp.]
MFENNDEYEDTFEFDQYEVLFNIRDLLLHSMNMICRVHEKEPTFMDDVYELTEKKVQEIVDLWRRGTEEIDRKTE